MRVAALLPLLLGCIGTGVRGDLRDIEAATRMPTPAAYGDVEMETPREALALLTKPIDVDAAVRIALLSNRELRATLREMGVTRGRLAQGVVLPNPVVEVELLPERTSNFELRVEYDITGLILAPLRANAAGPMLDAARYRAAAAVLGTGQRARAAFYVALAAQQKLVLSRASLDTLTAARDAARALFHAGNLRELDLATEEAECGQGRVDVADAELAAADAREALVRALGLHGVQANVELAGALPALPEAVSARGDLESRVVEASFDLKARKSELEGLGRSLGVARAQGWIPDVAADVHVLQGVRDAQSGALVNQNVDASGGVRVTVPLFDHQQGTAGAIDAEIDASLERYLGAAVDLRSRARALHARLVTAHARARQYQTGILPARKRASEQALLQYNAMQLGVFELLAAKRAELASELASVDALAAFWVTRSAFDALVAGGSADGSP